MADLSWREAIIRVLGDHPAGVHYAEIAQEIIDQNYRSPENVGATPASTVSSIISTQLKEDVHRLERGVYTLADATQRQGLTTVDEGQLGRPVADDVDPETSESTDKMGFINAFGMFWRRAEVRWDGSRTKLLGVQQSGSQSVDFSGQSGVYILYDNDRIVYVGRVTEPRLGSRMWEHTRDRLTGRWNRFSWFGVRKVSEDGSLEPAGEGDIKTDVLIATMEALLIEGLEPPQNRRQGDGFNAMEFLQETDPAVEKDRKLALFNEIGQGLFS